MAARATGAPEEEVEVEVTVYRLSLVASPVLHTGLMVGYRQPGAASFTSLRFDYGPTKFHESPERADLPAGENVVVTPLRSDFHTNLGKLVQACQFKTSRAQLDALLEQLRSSTGYNVITNNCRTYVADKLKLIEDTFSVSVSGEAHGMIASTKKGDAGMVVLMLTAVLGAGVALVKWWWGDSKKSSSEAEGSDDDEVDDE